MKRLRGPCYSLLAGERLTSQFLPASCRLQRVCISSVKRFHCSHWISNVDCTRKLGFFLGDFLVLIQERNGDFAFCYGAPLASPVGARLTPTHKGSAFLRLNDFIIHTGFPTLTALANLASFLVIFLYLSRNEMGILLWSTVEASKTR